MKTIKENQVVMGVFLSLLLAVQVFQAYSSYIQTNLTKERTVEIVRITSGLNYLSNEVIDIYHESAYDNPKIDRISEQQLLATESTNALLSLLFLQNDIIIDLLALP